MPTVFKSIMSWDTNSVSPFCLPVFWFSGANISHVNVPTGKQNALISNKNSNLNTSHLKIWISQILIRIKLYLQWYTRIVGFS